MSLCSSVSPFCRPPISPLFPYTTLFRSCYRVFDLLGWTEMIFNHITLRVAGPESRFLINPFGLHYREITASSLVLIDLEGNVLRESKWPVNRAGYVIHSAIHGAMAHAHCVMHTHTTNGIAVSCLKDG